MSDVNTKLRRVVDIAAGWAIVWLLFWTVVGLTSAAVDPDSIDPGEPVMLVVILGPMGLTTGTASRSRRDGVAKGAWYSSRPLRCRVKG